jgi:hypothetical protein
MEVYELFIQEDSEFSGVDAISIVEEPAIEEDFITLAAHKQELAKIDDEKRILMGAALVPNRKIYRKDDDKEYYIFFSETTVRKASELFLSRGKQNNSTLEHQYKLKGLSVVESWIVEDVEKDKTKLYNLEVPKGTWMVSVKVNNDEVWEEYVKSGRVKGFSIEGFFQDNKEEAPKESVEENLCVDCFQELQAEYELLEAVAALEEVELESYGGYPDAASNNAKLGIKRNKELNNKCATQVGKVRAQQLARKEKFTKPTLKRIYSYLSRAEEYYDPSKPEACGTISYLLWGGKSMKNWVESKLKGLEELKEGVPHYTADGKLWEGPTHKHNGRLMTGETHSEDSEYLYHKDELAKVKDGVVSKSPKAPKSDTPNKNPKGKGTAKGDASTSRGAKVSQKDAKALQKKADEFNEKYKAKLGYGLTVGMLKSVFQRGLGAFNTSHSPNVKSASQWAHARVNAFMYLVKNGKPQNAKYTTDYDLLPKKHPKSSKK